MMRLWQMLFRRLFRDLDQTTGKLREVRDSYRAMNVEIYGEKVARLLNDW